MINTITDFLFKRIIGLLKKKIKAPMIDNRESDNKVEVCKTSVRLQVEHTKIKKQEDKTWTMQ